MTVNGSRRLIHGMKSRTVLKPAPLYDPSRHGKHRWYVRIKGKRARMEGIDCPPPLAITPEVFAAYQAALERLACNDKRLPGQGSFGWLCEMYFRSKVFERLDPMTQRERRSVLGRIVAKHGDKPYALMETHHVERIRDEIEAPHAANKRVKCLRYLFKWAIKADHAKRNPAKDAELIRVASRGWTPWTLADVLQFEEHHPLGTRARLALALLLYTGVRRSDVVRFGDVARRGDRLVFMQHKGRNVKPKRRSIPLVAPLRAVLDVSPLGETTWLETLQGKPFSIAGFGNWFRDRCDEAGLQGLSAHGLRKMTGIIAAERGCTAHQIMQILGHDTLDEAERYTREANAERLADEGFARAFGDGE